MAKCKYCGAEIIWVKTTAGKMMPCDPGIVEYIAATTANERIVTPNGEVVTCIICETKAQQEVADGTGYVPHWHTCPGGIDHDK